MRVGRLLLLLCFWVLILFPVPFIQAGDTIRVGWYMVDGLNDYDADSGEYKGYNYEYLRSIAQFTGWNYEFVPGTFDECMERLATGEIDIVGGVGRNEEREKQYLYTDNSSGLAGPRLVTLVDNTKYAYNSFSDFYGMRVGYIGDNLKMLLLSFAQKHNFVVNPVAFKTSAEMEQALQRSDVDAILFSGTRNIRDYRLLTEMPQHKIYFIVTPQKPWVRDELDNAISEIRFLNHDYDAMLYDKYFEGAQTTEPAFTEEEKAYIYNRKQNHIKIIVAYDPAWIPAEYYDQETGRFSGIMADVFARLHEKTGLDFAFVTADSYADTMDSYGQTADLFSTVSYDYSWGDSHNVQLTQPVFDVQIFAMDNGDMQLQGKVALPRGYHLAKEVERRCRKEAAENGETVEFVYYDTMEGCIDAVLAKDVGRTYINAYELNYYMDKLRLQGINIQSISGFTEKTSIGVSRTASPLLFSIICRALNSISRKEIDSLIMSNTASRKEPGFKDYIYANPFKATAVATILMALLFGLFFFYYSSRRNARQRLELERANRAKSEFLSRISHDIRTPMNAIMGMTELALLEKVTPRVENYLRKIKLSNRFLLNLINDILDMSAIESGKIMLRPEAYSIRNFAEFIHSTIDPLMEKRNIEFTITIDPVIQGIFVDRLRFNQIFMNLLSNAAKFTPEGGRVELSLVVEKTIGHVLHVRGSVRDTGIGISEEFLPKLFSPFTQENKKHVNVTEGSGLGLAIVKRFVEAMEGTITVHSELGKGTDFIVQIPLEECELHTVAENEKIPGMDVVLQGKRVLVVEDNSINQEVVCHLLEHCGFSCEVANNGQEALDVFKNHRENWFDVILMDIRMPVMDGIEATSQLRKLDRADATIIPIIALTADAYTSERDQIMESGMTEYLAKPVEPQKLIQMLKKVLAMEEKSNNL